MTVRLPAHDKPEISSTWRCPGAWTSEEDLLDDQELGILNQTDSRSLVKKRSVQTNLEDS